MLVEFRERGIEKDRRTETCLLYAPWPRIEPATSWCKDHAPTTEPPGQGLRLLLARDFLSKGRSVWSMF